MNVTYLIDLKLIFRMVFFNYVETRHRLRRVRAIAGILFFITKRQPQRGCDALECWMAT